MSSQQNEFILNVIGVNIYYGNFQAVKDVSFNVKAGEIFGLLGPNGAGKTSTLSAVEGLLKPQSGDVFVAGYNIKEKPLHARASMGVQLQSNSFQAELNVSEIIQLFAGLYSVKLTSEMLRKILSDIKLEDAESKKFGQLSGGQQQRVSLALSTIHNPRLLLLDEPTTGLDPITGKEIIELMIEIHQKYHTTSLIISHDMTCVRMASNRVVILVDGRCYASDTYDNLLQYADPKVKQFFE